MPITYCHYLSCNLASDQLYCNTNLVLALELCENALADLVMSGAQDADSSGTEDLNESIRECSERLKTEREYLNKSRERKRKRLIKELDDELETTRLKNQKLEQEFKEKQDKLADLRNELRENVKEKAENNKKLGKLLNEKKKAELASERESLDVFGKSIVFLFYNKF